MVTFFWALAISWSWLLARVWSGPYAQNNERGEPTPSYRWTGRVWEITGWSSRLPPRKTTDHFRGMCRMHLNLLKKSWKITTCNRLDLETIGFWPIMPQKLLGHGHKPSAHHVWDWSLGLRKMKLRLLLLLLLTWTQPMPSISLLSRETHLGWAQCPGRILGEIGRDPNVSKSNWLHVHMLRFSFQGWRHVP